MLVIPAIDIKDGKCVRLKLGKMETAHTYFSDSFACADHWISEGASRLHLVDLNAAVGTGNHRELICRLTRHIRAHRQANPSAVRVQVGGGIRDEDTAAHYLDTCGADYIIVGTWAIRDPAAVCQLAARFPQRVYLSLDVADDRLCLEGWTEKAETDVGDILKRYADAPLAGLVMTDIARDGTLAGIRAEPFARLRGMSSLPIIAAGGVHKIADLQTLLASKIVAGVICGKSLYENTLNLKEALQLTAAT